MNVSTHSRLKAAGIADIEFDRVLIVSTHSRLKAAGSFMYALFKDSFSFNTQPPKGGWRDRTR